MTDQDLLALAEQALGHVDGEAQVTVIHERSVFSRFAGSRPTQATELDEFDLRVTAVRAGHTATASANRFDADGLAAAGRRAARAADAAAHADGPGPYPGLPSATGPIRTHQGFDLATARLDPGEAGDALRDVFATARERGLEAAGLWTAGALRTAIASTGGVRVVDAVTDAYLKVLCRDEAGRSGFAAQASTSVGNLDPAAAARAAASKIVAAESSELAELAGGEYPAVLDADAVGTLLDFAGALAFNGLAHAEGRSALSGRLGTRVAAAAVNLADSPRFPGTLPRCFDAEGVAKAPLPLIQDGIAHRVVHDTRSAAIAGGGTRSTGHAIAPGGATEGPLPRNLVLTGGGAVDVHELAAPVERGFYVTRLWYVNPMRERETLVTGMSRDGTFLIEDGKITRPLRDVRITDSILGLLERTEALTSQPRLVCEGEFYGRRFATGVVCPAIRVGALRVTGTSP
jgi:predicted Zn-dependent protease